MGRLSIDGTKTGRRNRPKTFTFHFQLKSISILPIYYISNKFSQKIKTCVIYLCFSNSFLESIVVVLCVIL